MMSAHDSNVHLASAALNFTSIECLLAQRFPEYEYETTYFNCEDYPQFASSLIFELHQVEQDEEYEASYQIMIKRDGRYMKLCTRDDSICPYEEFISRLENFYIDFDSVCAELP